MSSIFSRIMSAATASYAVFALAKPRHLGAAMSDDPKRQEGYDAVATTFGCRDSVVSAVGMLARSPQVVRTAMLIRIGFDLADAVMLAPRAETADGRNKVLGAALGWGALNSLAVLVDRRRDRPRRLFAT